MRLKKTVQITISAESLMAMTGCALQTPPTQSEQATGIGALGAEPLVLLSAVLPEAL